MTVSRVRILVLCFWVLAGAWYFLKSGAVLSVSPAPVGTDLSGNNLFWFKGNTHAHARISLEEYLHGDSSPAMVANWYRGHGYDFVVITDHNRFEDARSLNPIDTDNSGFLVIPGMEVTSDYRYPGVNQQDERKIHASALNINNPVDWNFDNPEKSAIIQQQISRIKANGGLHILNHPNYQFQIELDDILGAPGLKLFELYNAHPRSNQPGHAGFRPGVEALWDQVLSSGHLIYGVAADDAHDFKWYRSVLRYFGSAPPGGAWVMVKSRKLDAISITTALENGDFYSSTGVHLKDVLISNKQYQVSFDLERTRREVKHHWVRSHAPKVWSDDTHFVIEFIGPQGTILKSTHNQQQASIDLHNLQGYVRARVTYLEKIDSMTGADTARAYYAWTQPLMMTDDS